MNVVFYGRYSDSGQSEQSIEGQRKHGGCNKKNVQKVYIENAVIDGVLSILNDDYISDIAQKIADLSAKESNTDTIKRLKKLLKENEDANDHTFRTALIDTFINKIYLYGETDDGGARAEIYCNATAQTINGPINGPTRSSSMEHLAPPARFERTTCRLGGGHSIQLSYGGIYTYFGG